jgi:hypothetical protein
MVVPIGVLPEVPPLANSTVLKVVFVPVEAPIEMLTLDPGAAE